MHTHTHTHTHNSHHLPMYIDCADPGPTPPPAEVTAEAGQSIQQHRDPTSPYPVHAAPNPKVYLIEGEDGQAPRVANVAWSADVYSKGVPSLPVKPGTTYTLEVPPQQETVVMKFKTFGKSEYNCLSFVWYNSIIEECMLHYPVSYTAINRIIG